MMQCFLEHGGENLAEKYADLKGETVWNSVFWLMGVEVDEDEDEHDKFEEATIDLLRVLVLRQAPPLELASRMKPRYQRLVHKETWLRESYRRTLQTGRPF
jgi:hypothetical protein